MKIIKSYGPFSLLTALIARFDSPIQVVGNVASGAADSGNPVKVGGKYNVTAPTFLDGQRGDFQLDPSGGLYVNREGRLPTYSASVLNLAGANLLTDLFTITGSATKLVKVRRVTFQGSAAANTVADVAILKRSTANTGGTSTAPAKVPYDSADPAATATVLAYTANPTLGTLVGVIGNKKVQMNGTNTNPSETERVLFGDLSTKPIVLRGINEVFAINMNGVTITGDLYNLTIEWTEE